MADPVQLQRIPLSLKLTTYYSLLAGAYVTFFGIMHLLSGQHLTSLMQIVYGGLFMASSFLLARRKRRGLDLFVALSIIALFNGGLGAYITIALSLLSLRHRASLG